MLENKAKTSHLPHQQEILLSSDTNELEIVEFMIDTVDENGAPSTNYFGVNVAKVREIIRRPVLSAVPGSSPAIAGIMKLRDRVITIIDIAALLGIEPRTPASRIIVLEFNNLTVGVLVSDVSRIYRLSWENIEAPAAAVNTANITGLVKMEDRIILILDFEKLVSEVCSTAALLPVEATDMPKARATTPTVLVADDSTFIRKSIVDILKRAGFNVLEAENGLEALKTLHTGVHVDVLITDIEMPQMDGLHLTSKVRSDPRLKELPICIFSSLASEDNRRKWKELGANAILTKPELPNLLKIVDELLSAIT